MSNYSDAVVVLNKFIWMPEDYTNVVWCQEDYYVQWFNSKGEVYSMDKCDSVSAEKFVMFELDNGCGHGTFQGIFSLENEISVEEFEERCDE